MISCKKATEIISRSYEEPISLMERIALYRHLFICNLCRRFKSQLLFLRKAARRLPHIPDDVDPSRVPPGLKQRLRERLFK